jgi:type VI protein secretion system component VasF
MREAWGERPLAAPSNFAEVLDDARVAAGSGRVELLELCLTVLGLGFRGPYGDREGASRTRALMLELVQEIDAARKLRDTALLSPDAKHCQAIGTRVRHIPIWVMASAAAILVLILYYSFDSLVQARLHALGEVVWGK